jgi:hypothetical protein
MNRQCLWHISVQAEAHRKVFAGANLHGAGSTACLPKRGLRLRGGRARLDQQQRGGRLRLESIEARHGTARRESDANDHNAEGSGTGSQHLITYPVTHPMTVLLYINCRFCGKDVVLTIRRSLEPQLSAPSRGGGAAEAAHEQTFMVSGSDRVLVSVTRAVDGRRLLRVGPAARAVTLQAAGCLRY